MSDFTFESWTLPSTGSFTKRSELTRKVASYTLTDRWASINDGSLVLDGTSLSLDDILLIDEGDHSNDVGSVIRVLRDGTPVLHYVATDVRKSYASDDAYVPVTLQGMEWFLDAAEVKRFDYPDLPSYDPDWIYGAASILKALSGETTNELQEIWVNATTGTFTITDGVDTTDPIAVGASAGEISIRLETDITGITNVSVTGDGALKTPYEIEFVEPTSYAQLTIAANNTDGVISVSTTRQGGAVDERPWHKSFNPVTGVEHGNYQTFQTTTSQAPAGDTYSLQVDLDSVRWPSDYGGAQQIVSVRPGSLYRASVPVYCTQATDFRLVIRDLNENFIAWSNQSTTVPAGVWTTLSIDAFYIPDDVTEIIFRVGVLETTNIPAVYVGIESALLAPGKPADTVGFILRDLLVPINDRQVLTWLTPTWTDAADSTGAAWDGDIALSITRGQSVLQLLEFLKKTYGYAWDIRWNGSSFDWHMYNPNAGGTVRTVTISGKAEVVDSAPVVRRLPSFNHAEAEGADGQWGESNNAGSQTALGRLEKYFGNRQGNDGTQLTGVAGQLVSDSLAKSAGRRIRLQSPRDEPLTAYRAGDYVNVNLEPVEPKASLRVEAVTVAQTSSDAAPTFDVHLTSLVFDPETALVSTVRGLVRQFDGLDRAAPRPTASLDPSLFQGPAGTGGISGFTVRVAASNASAASKAAADFVCDGTADQEEIQAACTSVQTSPNGGTVLLSEGLFNCTAGVVVYNLTRIQGLGMNTTFVAFDADVYGFDATNGDGNEFADFQISTNQLPNTSQGAIYISNNYGLVDRVWVDGAWGTGVYVQGQYSIVSDCHFSLSTTGDLGVDVDLNAYGSRVVNNSFYQGGAGPVGYQLRVDADLAVVAHNVFDVSQGGGIRVPGAPDYLNISGNIIRSPNDNCIDLASMRWSQVNDNQLLFPGGWGIFQTNTGVINKALFSNNIVSSASGIHLNHAIYTTISGNNIEAYGDVDTASYGVGIQLGGAASDTIVEVAINDNWIFGEYVGIYHKVSTGSTRADLRVVGNTITLGSDLGFEDPNRIGGFVSEANLYNVNITGNLFNHTSTVAIKSLGIFEGGVIANNTFTGETAIYVGPTPAKLWETVIIGNEMDRSGVLEDAKFLHVDGATVLGVTVADCQVTSVGVAIHITGNLTGQMSISNLSIDQCETGMLITGVAVVDISNCKINEVDDFGGSSGFYGIHIDQSTVTTQYSQVSIVGCTINPESGGGGIRIVDPANTALINGNNLLYSGTHGIELVDTSRAIVTDNLIAGAGSSSANTYDAIILSGNCSQNLLQGNKIVSLTPSTRYGINLSGAAVVDTVVVGNDLRPSADFGTDALNDAGTDTVLTYPADATYGDNFTGGGSGGGGGGGGAGVSPAALASTVSLPQATASGTSGNSTVTLTPVTVAITLPQATKIPEYGAIGYPAPVSVAISLPAPTVTRSVTRTPTPMFIVVAVPTPTVTTT